MFRLFWCCYVTFSMWQYYHRISDNSYPQTPLSVSEKTDWTSVILKGIIQNRNKKLLHPLGWTSFLEA